MGIAVIGVFRPHHGSITEGKSVVAESKGRDDCKGAQGNFDTVEICILAVLFILIMVVALVENLSDPST